MSSFVERYQLIFEKDPNSKVFAPLAEAYRRMGLIDEAIDLAERGVQKHPHFSSGRVALGKCYSQKGVHDKAIENLKTAVDLSPENILAHQLLADNYLKIGRMPEALQAYKMVLFINPADTKIAGIVKKLEKDLFLSSENESIKEDFSMEKLKSVPQKIKTPQPQHSFSTRNVEREIALLDTKFDRGLWKDARELLEALFKDLPHHPEVIKRKKKLEELESADLFLSGQWISPMEIKPSQNKVAALNKMLNRIDERRKA